MKMYTAVLAVMVLVSSCALAADLSISTDHFAIPGEWTEVNVTANGVSDPIKAFSLSLALIQSRYAVVSISPGSAIDDCSWEYFSYRFFRHDSIPEYDLRDATHLLTVSAMAGASACHPSGESIELLNLRMLLDYETAYPFASLACTFHPVRFYWRDCRDNTLFTAGGETVLAATRAIDPHDEDTLSYSGYRPPSGPCPDLAPAQYEASMDALNGGLDFSCTDTLYDGRGDINLNGRPFEVADVVLFNCVFLWGLGCFDIDPVQQITQSDTNRDGFPLSVADLVYMVRLMVHELMPVGRLGSERPSASLELTSDGWQQRLTLTADQPVAGVGIRLTGGQADLSDIKSMDSDFLQVGQIGDTLTLLLIDAENGEPVLPAGSGILAEIPGAGWEVTDAEVVAESGRPFVLKRTDNQLPSRPGTLDNFPNPFNPTTNIVFNLENAGRWTVTIYDISGRRIRELSGFGQGRVRTTWNGLDDAGKPVASGVYLYRLKSSDHDLTRKMMLIK